MKLHQIIIIYLALFSVSSSLMAQVNIQAPPPGISEIQWKHFSRSWERQRVDMVVVTKDSQVVYGQLLSVSENDIEVWPEKSVYHPALGNEKVIRLNVENIYRLDFSQNRTFWQGAAVGGTTAGILCSAFFISKVDGVYIPYAAGGGVGMVLGGLVGGGISGLLYAGTKVKRGYLIDGKGFMLKSLESELEYIAIMEEPFKMHNSEPYIDSTDDKATLIELRNHSRRMRKLFARNNLHFAARGGLAYSPAQNQILQTLEKEGIRNDYSYRHLSFQPQLEASLNILPQLRIGATNFSVLRTQSGKDDRDFSGSAYSFGSRIEGYGGFLEFIPRPIDPFFERKTELSLGLGYYRYKVQIHSFLDDPDFVDGVRVSDELTKEYAGGTRNEAGLHFRVGFDYYFNRYFSLQLQSQAYLLKTIQIPGREFSSDIISEPIYLPDFRLNLSSANLSLGLRFHIPAR